MNKTNEQIAREAAAQAASDCRMALATEQPGDKAPGHAHFEAIIYKQVLDCLTQAQESREGELRDALERLTRVIDAAKVENLMRGVQLGQISWYHKATDAMDHARNVLAARTPENRT